MDTRLHYVKFWYTWAVLSKHLWINLLEGYNADPIPNNNHLKRGSYICFIAKDHLILERIDTGLPNNDKINSSMQTIIGTVTKNENLLPFLASFKSLKNDHLFKSLNFSIIKQKMFLLLVMYG